MFMMFWKLGGKNQLVLLQSYFVYAHPAKNNHHFNSAAAILPTIDSATFSLAGVATVIAACGWRNFQRHSPCFDGIFAQDVARILRHKSWPQTPRFAQIAHAMASRRFKQPAFSIDGYGQWLLVYIINHPKTPQEFTHHW